MHTEIALKNLVVSPLNVRKISSDEDVIELAHSIRSKGLIQNLTAFPAKGGKKYEVIAGGRRLQALQLLAKEGDIDPEQYLVRVNVVSKDQATDISLTENSMRADLHPLDQFEAFKKLIDDGASIEDVANSHSVTPVVVSRRLRMASAAPEVIEAYRAGDIELEKVMALCTTEDHKIQKKLLKNQWMRPESIRDAIQEAVKGIDADDRLVKFIGLEAYQEAGGQVIEDLFAAEFEDGSGLLLTDVDLVHRLAKEKLESLAIAAQIKQKFAWSKTDLEKPYFLYSEHKVAEFEGRPNAEDKKLLGLVYYIDRNGSPQCQKNLLNLSDRKKLCAPTNKAGSQAQPLPSALLTADATKNLTEIRTKALQCAIAADPDKALKLLVCQMIKSIYDISSDPCIGLRINAAILGTEIDSLEELQDRQFKACGLGDLMDEEFNLNENLEEMVGQMKTAQLIKVLAFLTAVSVDVSQGAYGLDTRSHEAYCKLGSEFKLDITEHFVPTDTNYFAYMPKTSLLEFLGDPTLGNQKKGTLAMMASDRVVANWTKKDKYIPPLMSIEGVNLDSDKGGDDE